MSKPLLFCDADGVLNVFAALFRDPNHRQARIKGFTVTKDVRHADWIDELSAAFTVHWSSLWEDDAPDYLAPFLGFGETWPVVRFERFNAAHRLVIQPRHGVMNYKMPAILNAARDRGFVVIDDDIEPWHQRLAETMTLEGQPALMLRPDPEFGLQRHHVDIALAFAAKLSAGQTSR